MITSRSRSFKSIIEVLDTGIPTRQVCVSESFVDLL